MVFGHPGFDAHPNDDRIQFRAESLAIPLSASRLITAWSTMRKQAKRFGINKQSKRRRKREKSIPDFVPLAIVPRCQAQVVQSVVNQKQGDVIIDPGLKPSLAFFRI